MNIPFIKYIAALLIFGSNGIVASHIAMSSHEIVFLRSGIGGLVLLLIFLLLRQKSQGLRYKKELFFLALAGAAMGFNWLFLYEGYRQIGVGTATLMCYCGPVIVMALGPILFQERLTKQKCLGFLAVFAGILCINRYAFQAGKTVWGLFCGAMAAVTYAVLVIFNKKAEHITGLENAMLQTICSFLVVAVFMAVQQGMAVEIPKGDWIPVLLLGIVNTGGGCYLYFSAIGRLPVQTVAVCGYLEPLSAVLLSAVLLGEGMGAMQLMGTVLILGGAMFAERKGKKQAIERQ
ncbi:MAG: DMT family transporter [Bacillota bacterium]|nr:DMT family transporter [Bacillota bacterium]